MMRVAVIGSTGQLGTDLVEVLEKSGHYLVFPLSHAEIECTDTASVTRILASIRPQVVVNCAAFVRVDEAENRREETFRVNALGALYVARTCAELNAVCVYISTDYVFGGAKGEPYTEEDKPSPINVYGVSKLAGENRVAQTCPRFLIVRMASLFGKAGARGKGGNFVETVIAKAVAGERLKVVNDVRMSPTYAYDAAWALEKLLQRQATGVFHLANSGACSWYEFARGILDLSGLKADLRAVSSTKYPTKARRPKDSSLRSTRLYSQLKKNLRPWEEALKAYLVEKGHIPAPSSQRWAVGA
jgi:dTDP-4-dehydrorhamnose reductase